METAELDALADGIQLPKPIFVYFIADGFGFDSYIKIGKSNNPLDRMTALQTANPRRLNLLVTISEGWVKRRNGPDDEYGETYFHEVFKSTRSSGEWFHWSPELERGIWWLRAFGWGRLMNSEHIEKFENAVNFKINYMDQCNIFLEFLKASAGQSIKTAGAWEKELLWRS